jgi:acetyl-CoA acetyltransferase
MRDVAVVGVGMTKFGKFLERSLKDLAGEAVRGALESAGIDKSRIEVAVVGNATAGLITGQEMIRGQVVLRELGIGGIPVINTENACASSSTAFHLGWLYVASGLYDVALVVGMEKLTHEDKRRSFQAIGAAVDVEWAQQVAARAREARKAEEERGPSFQEGAGEKRSMFMDFYAVWARRYMERSGATKEDFARVAAKNLYHGSLNPKAQYGGEYTIEDILNAPLVVEPLTRPMCSPISDGAAAAILVPASRAREFTSKPVFVRASVLVSGRDRGQDEPGVTEEAARLAYERAGVGPKELDVLEVHDASAPAELIIYEELGLCGQGEGPALIRSGHTRLGGRQPVNTSGGLIAKGHPIGATGVAQVCEIFWQLRGEAGDRQVEGAKVGLTENGGGMIRGEAAALAVHIFSV